MRSSHLLVVLLVLAALSADSAALSIVNAERISQLRWPDLRIAVLVSLAFSQVSLAAIWAAAGRCPLPGRLTMLVGAVASWSGALERSLAGGLSGFRQNESIVLLSAQSLLVAAPLVGYRVFRRRPRGRLGDFRRNRSRSQFSLAYLLAWMTATAVILGLIRDSVGESPLSSGPRALNWMDLGILTTCNTLVALAVFWASYGGCARRWRATLALLAIVAVVFLYRTLANSAAHLAALVLLTLLEALWLLVMLGVTRVAGIASRSGEIPACPRFAPSP